MKARFDDFGNGWLDVVIALNADDIDKLMSLLPKLKAGTISHFHGRRNDMEPAGGVFDIEICFDESVETDDMHFE